MRNHTRIYFEFYDYDTSDHIPCEVCSAPANSIHHIECRGMGGNPNKDKDNIFNLMAVCGKCHHEFGDKKQHIPMLMQKHIGNMLDLKAKQTLKMLHELTPEFYLFNPINEALIKINEK